MTVRVAVAILLTLLAAFSYALSNVLEQREAEQVDAEHSMKASLLAQLARRRLWVMGFVADAGGFVLAAAAMGFGAVVFVQPMLSIGLPISLVLGAIARHRRLPRMDFVAAFVLCGGIALFLYEVSPTGGRSSIDTSEALVWGLAVGAAVGVCLAVARHVNRPARAALMGAAASIVFALSAVLTKAFVHYLGQGVLAWVPHWEPYAMAVVTIAGFVILQSSFQVGHLAGSVAGVEATQPVAAVILGIGVLHEHVASGSSGGWLVVIGALVAIGYGVIVLARAEAEMVEKPFPSTGVGLTIDGLNFSP